MYLDQNHWIHLAQAQVGHPDGAAHRPALEAVLQARDSGRAVFPLSATHYAELQMIKSPRQRADVAAVMERVSGFATLLSRVVIMRLELEAILDELLGGGPPRFTPLPLIGHGVAWAFGRAGGLRVVGPDGKDVTDEARSRHPAGPDAWDEVVRAASLNLERRLLRGPTDSEVPKLRSSGYRPESAMAETEARAAQERQQSARLDAEPRWRRGRLRDVTSAREMLIELSDALSEALQARSIGIDAIAGDLESARAFVNRMPSTDVSVTLKTAAHRNRDKKWATNDIHDIDALSVAVPYCDVVVTEKYAHRVLTDERIDQKARTVVLRTLQDLPSHLG